MHRNRTVTIDGESRKNIRYLPSPHRGMSNPRIGIHTPPDIRFQTPTLRLQTTLNASVILKTSDVWR
uniref:Uncharacterized protein n=1 Tax=Candidatus Kentrum sp. LFY TaxID=2126342 RepID=A0A450UGX0_9GAMM|nr:MAG: hypothetical protein BECKLFY1418A_GA0070994_101816 [Candidatus Kentron sp. LFY]